VTKDVGEHLGRENRRSLTLASASVTVAASATATKSGLISPPALSGCLAEQGPHLGLFGGGRRARIGGATRLVQLG